MRFGCRPRLTVFRWLWHELCDEGTRRFLLCVSMGWLQRVLMTNPQQGASIWLGLFEESDRLHQLDRCRWLVAALQPFRRGAIVTNLVKFFHAKLNHRCGQLGRAEHGYLRVLFDPGTDVRLKAHAMESWGRVNYEQGRLALAERIYRLAIRSYQKAGDQVGVASCLGWLALLHRRRNDWTHARKYSRECLYILDGRRDRESSQIRGEVLIGLGIMSRIQGNASSRDAHRTFLREYDILHNLFAKGLVLHNQTRDLLYEKRYEQAKLLAHEADEIFKALSAYREHARVLRTIGEINTAMGQYDLAKAAFTQSLLVFRRWGDRYSMALAMGSLGVCLRLQGRIRQALRLLRASQALKRDVGDELGVGWALIEMARCHDALGDANQGLTCAERGWTILRKYRFRQRETEALTLLACLYKKLGHHVRSRWCRARLRRITKLS